MECHLWKAFSVQGFYHCIKINGNEKLKFYVGSKEMNEIF
jgi:hypothetical protein